MEEKVSIIIPVYNGSNYIRYAIESAINQTYKNIEIIIVNDGSNDNGKTREICLNFESLFPSKIFYYEKSNGGVSSALNFGIKHSNGDFICWLSHDDGFKKNKIKKEIKLWDRKRNYQQIIATRVSFINREGNKLYRVDPYKLKNKCSNVFDVLTRTINGCSLLIPKRCIRDHKFDEKLIYVQDTKMWIDLVKNGSTILFTNKALTYNRLHEMQVSKIKQNYFSKEYYDLVKYALQGELSIDKIKDIKKFYIWLNNRSGIRDGYEPIKKYLLSFIYSVHKDDNLFKIRIFISNCFSKFVKLVLN